MADDNDSYTESSDTYTEVTSKSWGSRLGAAMGVLLLGVVMFVGSTVLMYWNEGNSVRTGDAIAEAESVAVELPDTARVDPAFNGKLVHVTGHATTTETVADELFGVSSKALSLRREVEYYQWVEKSKSETRQKLGGGEETVTTYSYERKWVSEPVDSGNFKKAANHSNHVLAQVASETWHSPAVTLGAYRLPEFLISEIGGWRPLNTDLGEAELENIGQALSLDAQTGVQARGGVVYIGESANAPQIGDMRVSFTEVPPADISFLAKMYRDTFETFRASNGTNFSELRMGTVSMDTIFQSARDNNEVMTWLLRIVAVVLAVAGLWLLFTPLEVLASVIPLLGGLVGIGTGLIAILAGLAWSLVIIALSWLRFRPLLALGLLAVAGGLLGLLYWRKKKTVAAA